MEPGKHITEVYPKIRLTKDVLSSLVRKKHTDGKWYLNRFCKIYEDLPLEQMYNRFNALVYTYLCTGEITFGVKDKWGNDVVSLDANQSSEETRIKQL